MLRQNQTSGCLTCEHGTAQYPQTHCRRKRTGLPAPDRHRERSPEPIPTPPLLGKPPAPTSNPSGVQSSQIVNVPAGYTYSRKALSFAEYLDDEETKHNAHFDPNMLTDEG